MGVVCVSSLCVLMCVCLVSSGPVAGPQPEPHNQTSKTFPSHQPLHHQSLHIPPNTHTIPDSPVGVSHRPCFKSDFDISLSQLPPSHPANISTTSLQCSGNLRTPQTPSHHPPTQCPFEGEHRCAGDHEQSPSPQSTVP